LECARLADGLFGSILIASIVAYLIRSAFAFDTIGPLLMLYVLIGAVNGLRSIETASRENVPSAGKNVTVKKGGSRDIYFGIPIACMSIAILIAYFLNYRSLEATYHQYYGFKYFQANRVPQALASFKRAVGISTPYAANLERDYATMVAETYFYNPDKVPGEEAVRAVQAMEHVAREHPQDAFYHYALVDMYNQISAIDPAKYIALAEREAEIALELSPDRQEVYFSLAKTKSLKGDFEGAFKLLEYALALAPKVPDAHFYYGIVAFASGKPDIGYEQIKQTIALGRAWQNENEPRVAANFFADNGYIDEAIELYKISLGMREDPETRIKIGVAYFFNGDRAHAIEYISRGLSDLRATGADITQSLMYQDFLPILQELGIR
jgi:tetratricopeptide (TPR) repeat protein